MAADRSAGGRSSVAPIEVRDSIEPRATFDLAMGSRLLLATLSAAAGAIHLAMVPTHWGESVADGLAFAAVGWLQLAFAAIVLARPSRTLLHLGIVLNVAAIIAWVVSRTSGLPFGAHSGQAESAAFVAVTYVVFEAVLVIVCAVLAFQWDMGQPRFSPGLVVAGLAAFGVLALTTAALASPGARSHDTQSHDTQSHDTQSHDTQSHDTTTTASAASEGHTHGPSAVDDKGFSLLHNGQHDHNMALHALDPQTKRALDAQLAVTRDVAAKTPTVTAALAAGYRRVGPYFPGIGAHYMRDYSSEVTIPDGTIDDADLRNPFMLIFDGTKPTSRLAGFMYYSTSAAEPAGFLGRNDTWHYHESICFKYGAEGIDVPYGLDHSATPAQCAAVGGRILPQTGYMLHVWSVPGFEMTNNYGGVFGEANPELTCADGSYYMLAVDEWAQHPLDVCKAG
jgi:hypothetical protein